MNQSRTRARRKRSASTGKPKFSAWGVRLAAVAALAALAVAPSACGSTNSNGQTTTTTAPGY